MEVIDHADRVRAEAWWLREDLSKHLGIAPITILRTYMHEEWWHDEEPVISFWPCCRGAGGFATMVRT